MKNCIIGIGSITYANKVKRLFAARNIQSRIVKTDGLTSRGCAYGVEISQKDYITAIGELRKTAIPYRIIDDLP